MTNRVVLGQKGTQYGLWVSKPGINVLTATEDQMLLSTGRQSLQIVAAGSFQSPSHMVAYNVTVPNLGFEPLVLISGCTKGFWKLTSSTNLRLWFAMEPYDAGYVGAPTGFSIVRWAVTNQRVTI